MDIEKEFSNFHLKLKRSILYHRARQDFFDFWAIVISFITVIGCLAIVFALSSPGGDQIAIIAAATVAIAQFIELLTHPGYMGRRHDILAIDFIHLERELVRTPSDDNLQPGYFIDRLLQIEAREPPLKRYLDVICHIDIAHSIGSKYVHILPWYAKMFKHWLPG